MEMTIQHLKRPVLEEHESSLVSVLSKKRGVYTLVILLATHKDISIGRLGTHQLPEGCYLYTGSALGKGAFSLEGRISRHLRTTKKKKWHIDYLLADDETEVRAVIAAETTREMECLVNQHLKRMLKAKIVMRGFGSSDCRKGCGSHLLYLNSCNDVADKIAELYAEKIQGNVHVITFH